MFASVAAIMGSNTGRLPRRLQRRTLALEPLERRELLTAAEFADPDLALAVRNSLGLCAGDELTVAAVGQLTELEADSNVIDSLAGLENAAALESLRLVPRDLSVTSQLASLTPLQNLSNLTTLVLQGGGLEDSELGPIAGLSQLEVVDLSYNDIAGAPEVFPSLSSLTSLESLDLRYNSVEVVPEAVAAVSTLETLLVHGNPLNDDPQAGMVHLAGKVIDVDLVADHPDEAEDVADLADRLYNLPLKMYEYVLNTIQFEPYSGSMKGAEAVFRTGRGNAWDTSALLADLLDQAGIEVRYVHGVVELPVDSQSPGGRGVESWLGVATPGAAVRVLKGAYLDAVKVEVGDNTVAVQFDHLWPEANVQVPGVGTQWVALDASIKFRDCRESVRNMLGEVTYDTSAVTGDYFATARLDSPHEYYEGLVRDYLAENDPTTSIAEIAFAGPIVAQAVHALPTGVPYDIISQETAIAEIPASETYRVRITLTNLNGTTTYFQTNPLSLPEIGTMPLAVRPTPSGDYRVIPELLLNWETDAESAYDLLSISNRLALPKLTSQVKLKLEHFYPNGSSTQSEYQRFAADYMVIALDANQLSQELIADQWRMVTEANIAYANSHATFDLDENAGYLLHLAGMKYMHDTNCAEEVVCDLTGATRSVSRIASGLVTAAMPLQNWFRALEVGFDYVPADMTFDIKAGQWRAISIDDSSQHDTTRYRLLGQLNSAMEHLVWEELTNIRCMSTVKSLQLARERSIPVFEVTEDNWSTYSTQLNQNQSAWVFVAVYDAVQQGAMVTIPRSPTPLGDWDGVGYIVEYPSGSTSYMISGGLSSSSDMTNGGATTGAPLGVFAAAINSLVQTWAGDPVNTANGSVRHDETDLVFPGLGSPLEFSRHYHSAHTGGSAGFTSDRGLSAGWSFSYSDRLESDGDDRIWFTDSGDRLIFETDGAGGFITPDPIYGTLVYNGTGLGYTWTDKTGTMTRFDDLGRLVRREDRFGNGISVSYDGSGHIQRVTDLQAAGRYLDFTYTGDLITSISDFTGRTWTYQYDANGRLWKMTAPSDVSTPVAIVEYEYYTDMIRDGLLKQVTDPNGEETTFTYFANRRGFEVTTASGHTQTVTYNLFRNQTSFTDERGFTTYYTVDGVQVLPIRRLDFGTSTSPVATGYARVTGNDVYTAAKGYGWLQAVNAYSRSSGGDLLRDYNWAPQGTFLYDLSGGTYEVTVVLGDEGAVRDQMVVSMEGIQVDTITTAAGEHVSKSYMVAVSDGQLTVQLVDLGGVNANFAINGIRISRVSTDTAFEGVTGSVLEELHPDRTTTEYAWEDGERTAITDVFGQTEDYQYDSDGNITQITNRAGQVTSLTYTDYANLETVTLEGDPGTILDDRVTTYRYFTDALGKDNCLMEVEDALGNITSYTYPATNRGLPETVTSPRGTATTGDPDDFVTTCTYNTAGQTETTTVRVSATDTITVTSHYDARGNLQYTIDAEGNRTDYQYDLLNRVLVEELPEIGGARQQNAITYDAMGNPLQATLSVTGATTRTSSFSYDEKQQVVKAVSVDGTYRLSQYDAAGNLISETDELGRATRFRYDGMNRPIATIYPDGTTVRTVYSGGRAIKVIGPDQAAPSVAVVSPNETVAGDFDQIELTFDRPIDAASFTADDVILTAPDETLIPLTVTQIDAVTFELSFAAQTQVGDYQLSAGPAIVDLAGNAMREVFGTEISIAAAPTTIAQFDFGTSTSPVAAGYTRMTYSDVYTSATGYGWLAAAGGGYDRTTGDSLLRDYNWAPEATFLCNLTGGTYEVTVTLGDEGAARDQVAVYLEGVQVDTVTTAAGEHASNSYTVTVSDGQLTVLLVDLGGDTANFAINGIEIVRLSAGTSFDVVPDDAGYAIEFQYDVLGRKTAETLPDPDGGGPLEESTTTYHYDVFGNLRYVVDPLGTGISDTDHVTEYQYDALNRRTREILPDPDGAAGPLARPVTYFGYDEEGNLIYVTDARGTAAEDAPHTTYYEYDEANRLIREILPDPDGAGPLGQAVTRRFYDDNGNLRYVVGPQGSDAKEPEYTTEYQYDALNRMVLEILPDPDDDGIGAARPEIEYEYDLYGNLASVTDARDQATTYHYNLLGLQTGVTDALAGTSTTIYDAAGNPILVTDATGADTRFEYDAMNRLVRMVAPAPEGNRADSSLESPVTTYQYDSNGNLTAVTDPRGFTTWYVYDGWDRQVAATDALGSEARDPSHTITTRYDQLGNVVEVVDQLGRTTNYVYDNLGRLVEEQLPDFERYDSQLVRPTTYYGYDPAGNLKFVTGPRGSSRLDTDHTTWYFYDTLGRETCAIDPRGQDFAENAIPDVAPADPDYSVVRSFDGAGNLASMKSNLTDATDQVVVYSYDNLGRVILESRDSVNGPSTAFSYDAAGNLVSMTEGLMGSPSLLALTTSYVYDELDRQIRSVDALGTGPNDLDHATVTTYDAAGRVLTVTDPEGNATGYRYDRLGRLVEETDPIANSAFYEYDASGNLVRKTDRNGRVTEYDYNALNQRTEEVWLDAASQPIHTITWYYDAAGQLGAVEDDTISYDYQYDTLGNLTEAHVGTGPLSVPAGGGLPYVASPLVEFEYAYDEAGNLKEAIESSTIVTGLGATTSYDYDSLGRLTRITQTGSGATDKRVDFAYRDDSSYDTVTRYADLAGTQEVATSDYHTYDVYGRLTGLTHRHGLTDLAAYTWQCDAADRITQMTSPDGTSDLGYDDTSQLTSADHSYQTDEAYVYDANGNRVTASGSTYATGTGNRLADDGTFHYLYDQEGNRTARFVDVNANGLLDAGDTDVTEYQWDYRNRLVKVTDRASYGAAADQIVEYTYDYLNRRFEKTIDTDGDGTPEEYFYNIHRGDELALELTDADGLEGSGYSPELSQRYLYGSAVDEILAVEDAAGDVLWGLGDHERTIHDLVDSTGTVQEHRQYDTFGQIVSPANPTADFPQAFTGRPFDTDTSLYNYRARWYDPAVGRFVSEDPSGFVGGDANLYRYAGNSPLVNVDPSGLCFTGIVDSARDAVKGLLENDLLMAAIEVGASFLPGVGEAMDLAVAFAPDSTPLESRIALVSFGLGVLTLGMSPNVAPFLRATKGLGKMLNRADDVVDVARGLARTAGRGADDVARGVTRATDSLGLLRTRTPRTPAKSFHSIDNFTSSRSHQRGTNFLKTRRIRSEMSQSDIGRRILDSVDSGRIHLEFRTDTVRPTLLGESVGNVGMIYVRNTQSYGRTVATAIHEGIHAIGVRGSRRAEALARLAERVHQGQAVNRDTIRLVLKELRNADSPGYRHLPWTIGRTSTFFPGIRF